MSALDGYCPAAAAPATAAGISADEASPSHPCSSHKGSADSRTGMAPDTLQYANTQRTQNPASEPVLNNPSDAWHVGKLTRSWLSIHAAAAVVRMHTACMRNEEKEEEKVAEGAAASISSEPRIHTAAAKEA